MSAWETEDDLRSRGGLWRYLGQPLTYEEIINLYKKYYAIRRAEED
jgi:hypothetical protein